MCAVRDLPQGIKSVTILKQSFYKGNSALFRVKVEYYSTTDLFLKKDAMFQSLTAKEIINKYRFYLTEQDKLKFPHYFSETKLRLFYSPYKKSCSSSTSLEFSKEEKTSKRNPCKCM